MSGKTTTTIDAKIADLRVQSSVYGIPIPMLYGVNRLPGNVIWYGGFKAIPHTSTTSSGGKGGGTKTQNTTFSYTASVMMGVCHGDITGIPRIWRGKKLFDGGITSANIVTVTESYVIPSPGAVFTCANAAAFKTVVSITALIAIGSDAAQAITFAQGVDFSVIAGVFTFLNDAYIGSVASVTYQYQAGGDAETALSGLGLSFIRGGIGQAVWSPLTALAAAASPAQVALGYSGIAFVAGQDYDLGTGAQVENHTFEVQGPMAYTVSSTLPDPDPSKVLWDILTNSRSGAGFPPTRLDGSSAWSNSCVASGLLFSPMLDTQITALEVVAKFAAITNAAPVWSNGRLAMVPYGDEAVTGNGRTFTPNVTPVYDLTDDHFVGQAGAPVVKVMRKPAADAFNHVRIKFNNSANQYNSEIAEAKDQTDIDSTGIRSKDLIEAPWITSYAVARQVVQLMLQRSLYVRATYEFTLPPNYVLLEPMDLVTLTDASQGLSLTAVRITKIREAGDDSGALTFEAEEFPAGVATASLYPTQAGSGFAADYNVAPGSVSPPVIFEAPGALTTNGLELYVAASGAGANWGGARLWVSLDGANYKQMSTLNGASRYGTVTDDASGTLGVVITAGALLGGSATDAAKLSTLCYVAGATKEFFAFTTAGLTAALAYTLGGLVRGAYGTASTAHTAGDKFVRVDNGVARSGPLDRALAGQIVYVKLTSFNVYGGAEESLAGVTAYTYTLSGQFVASSPTANTNVTLNADGSIAGAGGGQVQLPSLPGALTRSQLEIDLGKSVDLIAPINVKTVGLDTSLTALSAAVLNLGLKASTVDGVLRDAGISVDPLSGTVKISGIEQTAALVNAVSVTLSAQQASLNLKASVSYVDAAVASAALDPTTLVAFTTLTTRVTTAETNISGLTSSVTSKADSTTVSAQEARLTSAESNISGLTGSVSLKANSTVTDGLNTRLTTAESTLTGLGDQASSVTDLKAGAYRLDNADAAAAATSLQALLGLWQTTQATNAALALAHEELTVKINGDVSAEAGQRLLLAARTTTAEAAIVTEQSVRAAADSAAASTSATIQARLNSGGAIGDGLAAVQTSASASASAIAGLSSQYGLKVQTVRSDGKVVLGSIGLSSASNTTGSQSEIILAADKLTFVASSSPNAATQPLMSTGMVNGLPALIITQAVIGDLTVGNQALADAAVCETFTSYLAGPVNTGIYSGA